MKLILPSAKIPALYATDKISVEDKIVRVRLFNPAGAGTWYIVEYDPAEKLAFGYADLDIGPGMAEWGYISIAELEELKLPMGLGIERDLHFQPCKFSEARAKDGQIV